MHIFYAFQRQTRIHQSFHLVFLAYAVVTLDNVVLFVNAKQLTDDVRSHLGSEVEVRPYEAITSYLSELAHSFQLTKEKVRKSIYWNILHL